MELIKNFFDQSTLDAELIKLSDENAALKNRR